MKEDTRKTAFNIGNAHVKEERIGTAGWLTLDSRDKTLLLTKYRHMTMIGGEVSWRTKVSMYKIGTNLYISKLIC